MGSSLENMDNSNHHPLLLVHPDKEPSSGDENPKLVLNQENLEHVLKNVGHRPLSIYCVGGPRKTGKTLLYGYMIKYLTAVENGNSEWIDWESKDQPLTEFQWSYSPDGRLKSPDTPGIWCCHRPFILPSGEEDTENKEVAVLLLYVQSAEIYDSALMGLAIVASSCTIFNFQKQIDEKCFSALASHFKYVLHTIQGNGCSADINSTTENIQAALGKAVFVIRDWNFPAEYPYGIAGGERFLKMEKLCEKPEQSREARMGRTFVKTMFEDVSGCLLPLPGDATLTSKFQGSIEEMGKNFVDKLEDFISGVVNLDELPLKRNVEKGEVLIGGIQWKALIERYINSVNSGGEVKAKKLLEVVGVKDTTLAEEQKEIMKRVMKIYGDAWKGLLGENGKIAEEIKLKETHRRAKKKALEAFQKEICGEDESEEEEEQESSIAKHLTKRLEERFQEIRGINEKKRMDLVEKWKIDMIEQYKDSMEAMFPLHSQSVPSVGSLKRESESVMKNLVKEFDKKKGLKNLASEREKFLEQLRNAEEKFILKRRGINGYDESQSSAERENTFEESSLLEMSYQSNLLGSMETIPCTSLTTSINLGNSSSGAMANQWIHDLSATLSFEDSASLPNNSFGRTTPVVRANSSGDRNKREDESKKMTNLIETLTQSYTSKLASGNEGTEHEEELERKRILEDFERKVSYSEETQEFKLYREMLDGNLKMARADAKMKRKQTKTVKENRLNEAVKEALARYQCKMNTFITTNGVVTSVRLEEASRAFLQEELGTISNHFPELNENEFQMLRVELEEKICNVFDHFKEENEVGSQQETRSLLKSCKEEYVKKMNGAMNHAKDQQGLHQVESMHRNKIMDKFRRKLGSRANGEQFFQELGNLLSQAFAEMETIFDAMLEGEVGKAKLTIANARQFYCEEMDKHFKNDNSILSEELLKIHKHVVQAAVGKVEGAQVEELGQALQVTFQKYQDLNKMNMKGEPAIGIDLGTTFSCAAVYQRGQVEIIPNSVGKRTTPSYVLFQAPSENGGQHDHIVGEEAKSRAYENPEGTIFDAKRILGRKFNDEYLQEDMKHWSFSVTDGGRGVPVIEVNGKRLNPEMISAILLAQLKKDAEDYLKRKVKKAVITVPAYFTDGQKQATLDAARMAKLEVLYILPEPVAAAIAYNLQYASIVGNGEKENRHILIFDLGGGTFDVAILKTERGQIEVLTKDGDSHLGGQDFDKNMMIYCAQEFKKQHNIDLFQGKDSPAKRVRDDARCRLKRLQTECERQKVLSLTTGRSAVISVKRIYKDLELSVKITRGTFERINEALFKKTIQVVDKALKHVQLDKSQIDDIVLVGGSTRIPKIQKMLEDYFEGRQLSKKINPDEAVAHGAGLFAAIKKGDVTEGCAAFTKFRDVTAMPIGVELYGGGFDVIIPKSTKFPVKLKEQYKTAHNNQTSVQITIYEGENPIAVDNEKLGDFYLNGIPPKNSGVENIDVEMVIDETGILHVTAKCSSTGKMNSRAINVTENKQRIGEAAIRRYLAGADNDNVAAA